MNRVTTCLAAVMVLALTSCASTTTSLMSGLSLSDEPLTGKFIWHDLVSTDIDADKAFYAGLFGWEYEQRRGVNGRPYTLAKAGDRFVAGMVIGEARDDGQNIARWLGYLSVPDVDGAVVMNDAAGGETVVAPLEINDFVRVAAVIDPQGAVLGLAQSRIGDPDDSTAGLPSSVVWNELLTDDPAAAATFYAALAGYQAVVLQRRGGEYITLKANGVRRAGILANPIEDATPLWLTYFGVSDIAASVAKVNGLGGRVLLAPTPEVRDGEIALVTGPSGALFALQQL